MSRRKLRISVKCDYAKCGKIFQKLECQLRSSKKHYCSNICRAKDLEGHIPWNKGKVGVQIYSKATRKKMSISRLKWLSKNPNPVLGTKHTEQWKREASQRGMGRIVTSKTRLKISKSNTGKRRTQEQKRVLSLAHLGQVAWNKGLKNPQPITKKTRLKISKKLKGRTSPMKGRKHKKITKIRMSKSRKGHKVSDKTKRKQSITMTSKSWEEFVGKTNAKKLRENARKRRLKQVFPKEDTLIEKKAQSQLKDLAIRFKKHPQILGQPDIYIPKFKLCIFLDGCYWHGCRKCKLIKNPNSPQGKHALKNWYRNTKIKKELEKLGYLVIRIWEHDINKPNFTIKKYLIASKLII